MITGLLSLEDKVASADSLSCRSILQKADPWPNSPLVTEVPSFLECLTFEYKLKLSNNDWRYHAELSWFHKRSTQLKAGTTKHTLQCQGIFRCTTLVEGIGQACGTVLRAPANPKDREKWNLGKACSKCGGFNKEEVNCTAKLYKEVCTESGFVLLTQKGR